MNKLIGLILVFVLAVWLTGCSPVLLDPNAEGKVVCNGYETSFEETLTPEEVEAVVEVLNGKVAEPYFLSTPSCGFSADIAIMIGNRRFALARDGCGMVQDLGSLGYIHISDEEQDVLEQIFTSRGGEFPCI